MSKIIEGKISNQFVRQNFSGSLKCEKCQKLIPKPSTSVMKFKVEEQEFYYTVFTYLQTPFFIYESNSGHSIVYCSDYCVKKHNHRFQK